MPSHLHEAFLHLFRERPALVPELLRDILRVDLPAYHEARIASAEFTDIQPAEYRADLVVQLVDEKPVCGVIVEVQLSRDDGKRFAWPAYVVNLRSRLRCPVCMLVVTADDSIARWAATPIRLGGSNCFVPIVLGPSGVPEIVDILQAEADPDLALLSAIAHGRDKDIVKSLRVASAAHAASRRLDAGRAKLYFDLIITSLSKAARREVQTMSSAEYVYLSKFSKNFIGPYFEKGSMLGRAALVTRQLAVKFGALPDDVKNKIAAASTADLDAIGERLLFAGTLEEALGES